MNEAQSQAQEIANRYRILQLLGEGGMGRVYRVFDTVRESECALKLLSQTLQSEDAMLQFRQEFWYMTRLRHPHIVNVFEYGVLDDQQPYLTMEIVPGEELQARSDLPLDEFYNILSQTARALGFIHSRQLVHADIKADNLRITPEGQVKLMDFGLMQALGLRSNGQITGTVAYLPPEIPQRGLFTEASDMYSLGVLAYELLTGQQPFRGESLLEIVKAHMHQPPQPPQQLRADIPDALNQLILKLLAKDPEERVRNSTELLAALSEISGQRYALDDAERQSYLSSHVLVARDRELQELNAALERVQRGDALGALVGAPAGVGKSRLIEEFNIQTQLAEVPFCEGICVEQGMQSYAPLIEVLNQALPHSSRAQLDQYGPILIYLLPKIREQGIIPQEDFDPIQQKILLFDAVVNWLKGLGQEQPLVLFVDDLHWADMATLELFNYLMRELQGSAVMLMGSFRDDEIPANSPLWQLLEEDVAHYLKLSPFSAEQSAELVQKMLRDVSFPPDFVDYFYGATSGNAFFIREMLRFLMEENLISQIKGRWVIPEHYTEWQLPQSIGDTIQLRLKRLSAPALYLVQRISVVGKRIELKLVEALFGAQKGLFDTLDELMERQFLVRESDVFFFPHDRVRETLYTHLDEELKKDIHQSVGEWLEEGGAPITTLAYHFKNGRDRIKAMRYLIEAGEQASVRMEATLLMHEGIQILEGLSGLPQQAEVLEQKRRKLAWVSYMIQPFICAQTNEALIESLQDRPLDERIEFESILISSWTMIGRNADALDRAQALLKQLTPDTIPYALVLFGRLNALLTRGELRQLVTEMEIAAGILKLHLRRLPRQLVWAYAFCCFIREDALAWLGEPVGQDDFAAVPRYIGDKHDFLDLLFWAHYPEVVRNSLIGHYHAIKHVSDEIFALIKKMGRPIQHENRFQICLAFAAIEHGELEEGEFYSSKVVALGQRMQNKHQQASGKILEGMIAQQRNHLDDAIRCFEDAVQLSRESQTDQLLPAIYRLAAVHLKQKNHAEAQRLLDEALELATGFRLENPYHQIHIYRLQGRLLWAQGGLSEEVEAALRTSLELAEDTANPRQLGLSGLSLGRWLGEQKRLEEAREVLERSAEAFKQIHFKRGERQVHELKNWLRKQSTQVESTPANASAPAELASATQGVEPQLAQELGYRVVDILQRLNLGHLAQNSTQEVNELSQRLEKVERVNQFSQLIMKSLDLRLVLNTIMDYVIDIAKADRGLLMLKNDENQLTVEVMRRSDGEEIPRSSFLNFSHSFTDKVMQTGQSIWVQDAQADAEFSQAASVMALDLRTIICVPLRRENEVFGLIYLDRQAINDVFSQQDLDLVESMATFATISLINARLHAQLQERNEHLEMLNQLSRDISTTLDLPELLQLVLTFCLKITGAEIGYIFLSPEIQHDPSNFSELDCAVSQDLEGLPLEDVQVSQSSINKVLSDKRALVISDMHDAQELAEQKSVMALDLKSIMCVPISGKEKQILGVVYVSSQAVNRTFTVRDLSMMEAIIRQVGMDIENRHLLEIRKKQELMDQELALARNIQSSMLPDYSPDIPALEIVGFSRSADAVGGDYYDYFKISDFEFGLAIGDVNGHGVSAGLLMSMAKSCMFVQGKIDPGVIPMMSALNAMIFGGTKERLFMTFVYSIFHLENNSVTLSSAGHHLPYHYVAAQHSLKPIEVRATYPLGVREKARFNEVTIQLQPDDVLLYYTDGIVEAHNPLEEEFGFERLEALLVQKAGGSAEEIKQALLQAYDDWVQGEAPEDDMTLVVVKARPQQDEKKLKTGFLTLINR